MKTKKTTKKPETTEKKQRGKNLFKPGQSGNPAGRPKGARHKFTTQFFEDFHEAWKEYGKPALEEAVQKDPVAFVNAAARLMPKEIDVDTEKAGKFVGFQFVVSEGNE